jgi:hypothetical protein
MEFICDMSFKIKFEILPLPDFYSKLNARVELSQLYTDVLLLQAQRMFVKVLFQQWQQSNQIP